MCAKVLLSLMLVSLSLEALSGTLLNCEEEISTSLNWNEYPSFLERKGLIGETSTPKNPVKISIFFDDKTSFLKGNNGNAPLKRITHNSFIEVNGLGDVFLWKLMKTPGKTQYLYQMKAYESGGPTSYTVAYKCD